MHSHMSPMPKTGIGGPSFCIGEGHLGVFVLDRYIGFVGDVKRFLLSIGEGVISFLMQSV